MTFDLRDCTYIDAMLDEMATGDVFAGEASYQPLKLAGESRATQALQAFNRAAALNPPAAVRSVHVDGTEQRGPGDVELSSSPSSGPCTPLNSKAAAAGFRDGL